MTAARALVVVALVGAFGGVATGSCAAGAATTQGTTAAVLIEGGPGEAREFCVEIGAAEVDGLELLRATGAELVVQDFGTEVALCRIDGIGCDHPREPCFCACSDPSAECTFWSIHTRPAGGGWAFADVGITQVSLRAGDVLGLRWGAQAADGSAAPAVLDPEGICARAGTTRAIGSSTPAAGGSALPWVALAVVVAAGIVLALRRAGRQGEGPA